MLEFGAPHVRSSALFSWILRRVFDLLLLPKSLAFLGLLFPAAHFFGVRPKAPGGVRSAADREAGAAAHPVRDLTNGAEDPPGQRDRPGGRVRWMLEGAARL